MSNLNIPADQWLKELFEHEWCAECGRDHRHHTAIPFAGNWFARCDREPVMVDDELVVNPEGLGDDPDYDIEISADVELSATIRVWVSKSDWAAKTDEQRRAYIGSALDSAAIHCDNVGTLSMPDGSGLSVSITGPENAKLDLYTYDPKE